MATSTSGTTAASAASGAPAGGTSTPPFPSYLKEPADAAAIAAAAWAQSFGSVEAFNQLCTEHVSGVRNLLGGTESGT